MELKPNQVVDLAIMGMVAIIMVGIIISIMIGDHRSTLALKAMFQRMEDEDLARLKEATAKVEKQLHDLRNHYAEFDPNCIDVEMQEVKTEPLLLTKETP